MIYARLSRNRKYVLCGACRRSLCRRDERSLPGGPAILVDGRLTPGKERTWVLAWEDGWSRVDDHIERQPRVQERLAEGWKPVRHDWTNERRLELSAFLRGFPPAMCQCGTANIIDPKRLAISRVAAY
jgi:hypothetical protein